MKQNIIRLLTKFKKLYATSNDKYRANAYANAIKSINILKQVPSSLNELTKIKGIGKRIAEKIIEYIETGKVQKLKELEQEQVYIAKLIVINGIGPNQAKKFVEQGITSLTALKYANKSRTIKLTHAQKFCLEYYNDLQKRIPRAEIDEFSLKMKKILKRIDPHMKHIIAGSYRRGAKTSGDIDVVIWSTACPAHMKIDRIMQGMKDWKIAILSNGAKKISGLFIIDKIVRRIDLLFTCLESKWAAINYFTGSKETNIMIRARAKELGYTVNEHHLKKGNKIIPLLSESSLYNILGLKYIEPTNR